MVVAVTMASRTKIVNLGLLSGGLRFFFCFFFVVCTLICTFALNFRKCMK